MTHGYDEATVGINSSRESAGLGLSVLTAGTGTCSNELRGRRNWWISYKCNRGCVE